MKNQVFSFVLVYIYTILAVSLGVIFDIIIHKDNLSNKLERIKDIIICSGSIIVLAIIVSFIGVVIFIG